MEASFIKSIIYRAEVIKYIDYEDGYLIPDKYPPQFLDISLEDEDNNIHIERLLCA